MSSGDSPFGRRGAGRFYENGMKNTVRHGRAFQHSVQAKCYTRRLPAMPGGRKPGFKHQLCSPNHLLNDGAYCTTTARIFKHNNAELHPGMGSGEAMTEGEGDLTRSRKIFSRKHFDGMRFNNGSRQQNSTAREEWASLGEKNTVNFRLPATHAIGHQNHRNNFRNSTLDSPPSTIHYTRLSFNICLDPMVADN